MSQGGIQEVDYLDNAPHQTYLVTFNQFDYRKFHTCWFFAAAVVATFGANNVDYFLAAKENHETSSNKYHYHVALLIIKSVRWKTPKSCIFENFGATVTFATSTDTYVASYRYVTKSDKMPFIGIVLK